MKNDEKEGELLLQRYFIINNNMPAGEEKDKLLNNKDIIKKLKLYVDTHYNNGRYCPSYNGVGICLRNLGFLDCPCPVC